MLLISALLLVAAVDAEWRPPPRRRADNWRPEEAMRRYGMHKPTPVKYDPKEIDQFLFGIMEKLEDMPMPADPKFEFIRDTNKQVHACEIPEDDGDSMESSPNPDDVMETVMRSFADGKCASRRFGEWYYQVCGNLGVKRSPFTVTSKKGKARITPFRAFESLGVIGRDRKVSSHLASVSESRYVEQTYYGGAKCNLGGDARYVQTTVTFECSGRFTPGYVHINEAVEENPCKFRLQLQSRDFCDNDWLLGMIEDNSVIRCRIYFHPERIAKLMEFLKKFEAEQTEKKRRFAVFMEEPLNKALLLQQSQRSDMRRERVEELMRGHLKRFDKIDVEFGLKAERERIEKMFEYVMSELTWASMNPEVPYNEHEKLAREKEEAESREEDKKRLANSKRSIEMIRDTFIEKDPENESQREYWETQPYSDVLAETDIDYKWLAYYASWLDYLKSKESEEWMEHSMVRPILFPPHRSFPVGSYLLLENLVKSEYGDSIRKLFTGLAKEEEMAEETTILYDGESIDDDDLEEIARRFMQVYKEIKKGGDSTVLFDLLDDEDIEY